MKHDLPGLRKQIEKIDMEMVELLRQRSLLCREIGKLKKQKGLAVHNRNQEKKVLSRLKEISHEPVKTRSLLKIFSIIIKMCRSTQKIKQ